MEFDTLSTALRARTSSPHGITFIEAGAVVQEVAYAALYRRALHVLHFLQSRGVRAGDELVLCLGRNVAFVDALWACLLGGIVAVPLVAGGHAEHRRKVARVLKALQRPCLFTERALLERLAADGDPVFVPGAVRTLLVEHLHAGDDTGTEHATGADDVALIQFSSGSTGEPKGVVLSHRNVLANLHDLRAATRADADDVFLSWMPLTHDMGLVGFHLGPLVTGARQCLMPTDLFVRRPLLWLEEAARQRATMLSSPNFGYRHVLAADARRLATPALDLSSVRLIFNGAEPISAPLCDEFLRAWAPSGLAANAMFPVYGLAEATLAVATPTPGERVSTRHLARDALGCGDRARTLASGEGEAVTLVGVGRPIASCEVLLADARGLAVGDGHVGRLLIRGAGVTRGYYAAKAADAATPSGWLDTGDLAVQLDSLYIVGRSKDTLIVNGQNLHAHDLEQLCERGAGIEAGKVAAVASRRADDATDAVVVFVQHRASVEDFAPVARRVRAALREGAMVEADAVVPVRALPHTTSGKLQRFALRDRFAAGEFAEVLAALQALAAAVPASPARDHSATESALKEIFDAALGGAEIGVDTDLLDGTWDSLTLAEVHAAIDAKYPKRITLEDFYDYPTIAAMARHLDAGAADPSAAKPAGALQA